MNDSHSSPKRAAIFDLDGTMVDSMPFVIETFAHAVEPFRARPTAAEVISHLGGPLDACLRSLLGAASDSVGAARERLLARERGREAELTPFAGAMDLLVSLRERGVKLGLWTGRDRWSAQRLLDLHGLSPFFGAVVCGDDLPAHKPDPAGLHRTLELLGVAAHEAIFLGDADVDILAGHAAGVHTILVHHGRTAAPHIHSRASEVFRDPAEAYAAVLSHFRP